MFDYNDEEFKKNLVKELKENQEEIFKELNDKTLSKKLLELFAAWENQHEKVEEK